MEELKRALKNIETTVKNKNMKLAQEINNLTHEIEPNPMIASFAKPSVREVVKNDSGVVHAFSVEIKSSEDGPIPDTQLMSKILQAIEGHNGVGESVGEMSTKSTPKLEVVSFKYERREENKKK